MKRNQPNIVLFTTDQHRGDHLGLAGHPALETPNVDSFVQHGAYFPNAYSEIPSTTGARRYMHGGQGSHACGLIGYAGSEWHEPNTLARVLAPYGITVNAISPGFIASGSAPEEELRTMEKKIPAGYVGSLDDAVAVAAFLLSDQAKYVNGANIHLSGAWGV